MLKNYFKVAIRNLAKNRVFSFINISGLAIGLGAFLLIFQFINFEKSYDNFHHDADRIYRIQYEKISSDNHDKSAGLAAGAGPGLKAEFPEIEVFSKMWDASFMTNLFAVEEESFIETGLFYADENFFDLFQFNFVAGEANKALNEVNSVVLSQETAIRFFGKTDVIGELVKLNNGMGEQTCKVTGVLESLPANTHFDFHVLVSFKTLAQLTDGNANTTFGWNAFPTYVRLSPGVESEILESKFPSFIEKNYASLIESGVQPVYKLMPLKDIYLKSNVRFEVGPLGDDQMIKTLAGISLFIVILAYFNYVNLSTSQAIQRIKEIGVRKVTGATKSQVFTQFIIESFLFNIIGLGLGFTIMQLSKPFFDGLVGKTISTGTLLDGGTISVLLVLLISGTLLAGIYPSLMLSRFRVTGALKGTSNVLGKAGLVRQGLVVFQFVVLCFLLIGSLTVRKQINFMLKSDWGFNSEQMLIVNGPASGIRNPGDFESFRNKLEQIPGVLMTSNSTIIPGKEISWINNNVRRVGSDITETQSIPYIGINDTYVESLGLNIIAGRNFDKSLKTDEEGVLLSKKAVGVLGFKSVQDAIGKKILDGGREYGVLGVVDDYLQQSFKSNYNPIAYRFIPAASNFFNIRIEGRNKTSLIREIEGTYSAHFAANPFEYVFLDEFFQRQFEEDVVFAKVFDLFTLMGFWISCLGLIGLTSYGVSQKRKEIGIRKVLGATVYGVMFLISKKYVSLVIISVMIAIPISFYAVRSWLSNYSFAADIAVYLFVAPVFIILIITLIMTGLLSFRAAAKNPVESLRYE